MSIMGITTDEIEFFNKSGRKIISVSNETGSIQIVGLENIEKLRKFLNELEVTNKRVLKSELEKEDYHHI